MSKQTKRSHHLATISLSIMGIGFISVLPFQRSLWGTILEGGFESGLVGGLADWFAVTALFRHPLGIPIPHTALLPKNRTRITQAIKSMVEKDWLTKESIKEKIKAVKLTEIIFGMIEKEQQSNELKQSLLAIVKKVIEQIDVRQFVPLLEKELKTQLHSFDLKFYLPKVIEQISDRKYDEKALDYVLNEIDEWANKEETKNRLGRMAVEAIENIKADGFMQFALKSFSNLVNEEKLGNIIQSLIQKGVSSFRERSNQNRLTLLWNIQTKLQNMKTDEKLIEELNHWKAQLVNDLRLDHKILEFLTALQQKAIRAVEEPSFFDQYLSPLMNDSLDHLKNDSAKIEKIENWLHNQAFTIIEKNHSKIGNLVEENLAKLDDQTLIEMLENNVGRDLQWIRVNGAICGFLIGLILVGIRTFI